MQSYDSYIRSKCTEIIKPKNLATLFALQRTARVMELLVDFRFNRTLQSQMVYGKYNCNHSRRHPPTIFLLRKNLDFVNCKLSPCRRNRLDYNLRRKHLVHQIDSRTDSNYLIPEWYPHYGETVFFKESYRLHAGNQLISQWQYNNSESNPKNPFVPATLVDLARKTGVANLILHVAPVNPDDADELAKWNLSLLRKRQRAQQ